MKTFIRSFLVVVLAALAFASCKNNENPILSSLPADTYLVVKLDVNKFVEAIDTDGKYVVKNQQLDFNTLKDVVDLSNVVVTADQDLKKYFLSVVVNDEGGFAKYVESQGFKPGTVEAGKAWSGDVNIVLKDKIARISECSLSEISVYIQNGEKAETHYADNKGVVEVLNSDHMANFAVVVPMAKPDENKDGAVYTTGSIDMKDKLTANFASMYADGSPWESNLTEAISTAALQYVPNNAFAVVAFGLKGANIDVEKIIEMAGKSVNAETVAMIVMASEYLKRIDGTVVVSAAMRPGKAIDEAKANPLGSMDFLMMIHMTQENLNATLAEGMEIIRGMGMSCTEVSNGLYNMSMGEDNIYFGSIDGYLTVSNVKPNNNNGSAIASKFEGKDCAIMFDLPEFSKIADGKAVGLNMLLTSGKSNGVFEMSFPGATKPFFQVLEELSNSFSTPQINGIEEDQTEEVVEESLEDALKEAGVEQL